MELEPVIGLEVHVQLKTKSKMFCSCSNAADDLPPNSVVCPICLGHPGSLPVANEQAIRWGVKTAIALNCTIPTYSKFDRKHYFYPDLPKAYQISQFDQPVGQNGFLKVIDPETKEVIKIGINRLHLEEDAAKNTHTSDGTLVDYNRGGTPLMEIVSEPDLQTPALAKAYLQEMRQIILYLGVSDADMEKGNMRCDANISMRPKGEAKLYPKTEVKNINSFNNVMKALEFEIERQSRIWEETGTAPMETTTRGWNDEKGITEDQRTKEAAHDYRYFPDPDIPPLRFNHEDPDTCKIDPSEISVVCLQREIPELPYDKRKRFIGEYGLHFDDVQVLIYNKDLALFTDQVISELESWAEDDAAVDWHKQKNELVQLTINWMINRLSPILESTKKQLHETELSAENFAELMLLSFTGKVNSTNGLKILELMVTKGGDASQIMIDHDLGQMSDTGELEKMADEVIAANPKSVEDYKNGKEKALQSLVGQIMGKSKGKANPGIVLDIIKKKLS